NPLAHIDIIGTILFPVISRIGNFPGIGWMKPVPVNLSNLKHPLRDDAIISFAGPFSNFVQACIAILLIKLLGTFGGYFTELMSYYAIVNILLMGFNLLPFPPLDGGGILRFFLPNSLREPFDRFSRYSPFILLALIFLPELLGYPNSILELLLSPFIKLFEIIIPLDIYYLILLNLFNVGIVCYFFRDRIKRIFIKTSIKAQKISVKKDEIVISLANKKLINLAESVIPKLENRIPLKENEKIELDKLKDVLDSDANICQEDDYNINDNTCKSCEWFKNCLDRKVKNEIEKT
ncbi:MAG: site-2 protease family protein, partial [Spirochaetota bacterium]|nr:site-2 protease family protein [Spirochaetota bacterium]